MRLCSPRGWGCRNTSSTNSFLEYRGGMKNHAVLVAALLSQLPFVPQSAVAQGNPTITITSGSPAGGTYDATSRFLARHLPRFLPGNPKIIVQNAPAAGGLVALNQLFNTAPRDGTALAVVDGALMLEALFNNPAAKFDPRKFRWIGSRAAETPLCAVLSDRNVNTIADALEREVIVGAVGGSRTDHVPRALNTLLGTKFKIITGYPGSSELIVALEHAEIDGLCGWSWTTIKRRVPEWIANGKIKLIVQTGFRKANDIPDVPLALDLVPAGNGRQIMRLLFSDTQIASPLVAPPGLADAKLAELRNGFDAALRDVQVQLDAMRQQIDLDPIDGSSLQKLIEEMFSLPAETTRRARDAIRQ